MITRFTIPNVNGEIGRLFRDVARPAAPRAREPRFQPIVDVREEADRLLLVADLPGVRPEDVLLTFENGVLILSGERKEPAGEKAATYHRAERVFGSFERRFSLPSDIDAAGITASEEHGVLTITLPKRAEAQKRTIEIKTAR